MFSIEDGLIGVFVVSMMLSFGAELSWSRLRTIVSNPKLLFGGMVAGYVIVPLSTWLIGNAAGLSPALHAGMLLCAAAPGGPIGALFTQRAGANLAMAVSLLMAVNLINLFATPLTLHLLGATPDGDIVMELLGMFATILCCQVLPLVVGIEIRARSLDWAQWLSRRGKQFANAVLLVAIIGIALSQHGAMAAIDLKTLLVVEIITLIAMFSGWLLIPGDAHTRAAGALSNTIRSQSLSILLAKTRFPHTETLLAVLCFSMVMFFNGLLASQLMKRRLTQSPPTP